MIKDTSESTQFFMRNPPLRKSRKFKRKLNQRRKINCRCKGRMRSEGILERKIPGCRRRRRRRRRR